MTLDAAFIPLLLTMAAASFLCRASGFWLMRFAPVTPRVQAALNATPLAVMVGIVALPQPAGTSLKSPDSAQSSSPCV